MNDTTGKIDVAVPIPPGGGVTPSPAFLYSYHIVSAYPIGTFDSTADANIHLSIDLPYSWMDRINSKLYLDLNQFTEEFYTDISHLRR